MLILPANGRHLRAGPTQPTVKVGPHLGSRLLGVMESELVPGGGFPAHTHDEYEEAFYVLAGEIEYLVDGVWMPAHSGATLFVPPGATHGFRNSSHEPAIHLAITSPAAAMTMVEEVMNTSPDEWSAVLARHASRLEATPSA